MVKWTPKSESDLDEILNHVAGNFTIELAISTVEEIINFTESTLAQNPLAGAVFEKNPIFFKLSHKGNTIFYCENPKDKNLYVVYVQARQTDFKKNRINQNEVA